MVGGNGGFCLFFFCRPVSSCHGPQPSGSYGPWGSSAPPTSPMFSQVLQSQHLMEPHPRPGLWRLTLTLLYSQGN